MFMPSLSTLLQTHAMSIRQDVPRVAHVAEAIPARYQERDLEQVVYGPEIKAPRFSDFLMASVRDIDAQDRLASEKMADVDRGANDDVVGAMMMSQEASLSFSMLMQVRNKVVGAIDDLIKMPI